MRGGMFAEHLHHAAEGRVAEERGAGAAHDFNALDVFDRNGAPVRESRFGIADRHAVDEQLHVLHFARAEEPAARHHRRRAGIHVDQLQSRHEPQRLPERLHVLQLLGAQNSDRGRALPPRLLDPLRGDDDGLGVGLGGEEEDGRGENHGSIVSGAAGFGVGV